MKWRMIHGVGLHTYKLKIKMKCRMIHGVGLHTYKLKIKMKCRMIHGVGLHTCYYLLNQDISHCYEIGSILYSMIFQMDL